MRRFGECGTAFLGAQRNFLGSAMRCFGERSTAFWGARRGVLGSATRHATSLLMPPSAFSLVAHRLYHILPLPAKGGEIYSDDFGAMEAFGYVAVAYLAEIGRELTYQEL